MAQVATKTKRRKPARVLMNAAEIRSVYSHLSSTLMSSAVRRDPDSLPLQTFAKKLQKLATEVFCRKCRDPEIHARGLCEACYRTELRQEVKLERSA